MRLSMASPILILVLSLSLVLGAFSPSYAADEIPSHEKEKKPLRVLFTSDIHSYLEPVSAEIEGKKREHGGIARLATLIDKHKDDYSIALDCGDMSMGTLFQAGFLDEAYELRGIARAGIDITTIGNHEFDFGGTGLAKMLCSALTFGDPLPLIVQSNIDFSEELSKEQELVKTAFEDYGVQPYVILERGGYKIAVFGLMGEDSIEDAPTSGMKFIHSSEAAKKIVAEVESEADFIICLSHGGMNADGKEGEDIELAKTVPGIDLIVSGHSHNTFHEPIACGDTLIVSCGKYLEYLGSVGLVKDEYGKTVCTSYELIPIDEGVAEDSNLAAYTAAIKEEIEGTYLKEYAGEVGFDEPVAFSNFSFISLRDMYAGQDEFPLGNLIADSYIYEAGRNGINDIDVALTALGTIRGSINKGIVSLSDTFEICSLGAGGDGSAGHPLLTAYISGKELRLLAELDASLGDAISSIRMSYSGLRLTYNTARVPLDRITECVLVKSDGTEEELEDEKLYKVCCNMYAANMLGMVNNLTKGILTISPKDEKGETVTDYYSRSLYNSEGKEVKEWIALKNYLQSFPGGSSGLPEIPSSYAEKEGRKLGVAEYGLAAIKNPGPTTSIAIGVPALIISLSTAIISTRLKRKIKKTKEKGKELC